MGKLVAISTLKRLFLLFKPTIILFMIEVSDIFLHFASASASSLGTWLEEQFQQLLLASRIFSTLELEEHVQVLKVTYGF
ncbi:hypothetical protein KY289_016461 [Solanum tuberosum]|nr:hypothetical protein KY289_016461 [Solanum tuberosum]